MTPVSDKVVIESAQRLNTHGASVQGGRSNSPPIGVSRGLWFDEHVSQPSDDSSSCLSSCESESDDGYFDPVGRHPLVRHALAASMEAARINELRRSSQSKARFKRASEHLHNTLDLCRSLPIWTGEILPLDSFPRMFPESAK